MKIIVGTLEGNADRRNHAERTKLKIELFVYVPLTIKHVWCKKKH